MDTIFFYYLQSGILVCEISWDVNKSQTIRKVIQSHDCANLIWKIQFFQLDSMYVENSVCLQLNLMRKRYSMILELELS